jgi:hypothetical protein
MHTPETIAEVLRLRAQGLGARRISARLGIPVSTITTWLRGRTPRSNVGPCCGECGGAIHQLDDLPPAYVYLLSLYLGDGYIAPHARGVYRLRIKLDIRYPEIVTACEEAMQRVMPANPRREARGAG